MKNELTQEKLKELLHYDPNIGDFIWKERKSLIGKQKAFNTRFSGKKAGVNSRGYLVIRINDNLYFSHRLAWLYVYSQWPIDQIDHINGIRNDNRIVNLREAINAENCQNLHKASKNNKSTGLLGAFYCKIMKKFTSKIGINGNYIRLGYFETALEAHEAYLKAKREFHQFNTL